MTTMTTPPFEPRYTSPNVLRVLTKNFMEKIERRDECWIWTGAVTSQNPDTGSVGIRVPRTRESRSLHAYAHELLLGKVPDGMRARSGCGNWLCVNPEHLTRVKPVKKDPIRKLSRDDRQFLSGVRPYRKKDSPLREEVANTIDLVSPRERPAMIKELAYRYMVSTGTIRKWWHRYRDK
jgi:hypothetical protein